MKILAIFVAFLENMNFIRVSPVLWFYNLGHITELRSDHDGSNVIIPNFIQDSFRLKTLGSLLW